MDYWHFVAKILSPYPENIDLALEILRGGGSIGLPTETVYGLASDATNATAIANIFAVKNRPQFNPLISHVSGLEMALEYGVFSEIAQKLAKAFWPGPLTIVVPRRADCAICDLACAGLETVALRAPKHPAAQEIITRFGKPIAAPSANISGSISPTSASDVLAELGGKIEIIIDGGNCEIGLESTVVAVIGDEVTLLRHGSVGIEELASVAGVEVNIANLHDENSPKSPGMMLRHYAPKTQVRLDAASASEDEVFISFGTAPPTSIGKIIHLSPSGNLTEAAANLYAALREADKLGAKAIAIAPIPNIGIGAAINDRLGRASDPAI
ncbi:MAG: tRNA threonylcarbamoyladenosine biosynthesis protein [Hyphomonadaceae bacterium]|nr:MAG: tRNA threonylcarbamoyladenosine biosynthesis protein [Hyphomonadaceae bacterium]